MPVCTSFPVCRYHPTYPAKRQGKASSAQLIYPTAAMQPFSVHSSLVLTTTRAVHSVSQQRDASGNIRWRGNVLVTLAVSCVQGDLGRFNIPMCAEVLFDSWLEHFQTNKQINGLNNKLTNCLQHSPPTPAATHFAQRF
jgi:hypothetical protein